MWAYQIGGKKSQIPITDRQRVHINGMTNNLNCRFYNYTLHGNPINPYTQSKTGKALNIFIFTYDSY